MPQESDGANTMQLREVLTGDAAFEPRLGALEVTGVSGDSRNLKPGDIFVALAGSRTDGSKFVADAIAAGAVAVVSERQVVLPPEIAFVRVGNARRTLALAA